MPSAPTYEILSTPVTGLKSLGVIVDQSVVAETPELLPPEGALYGNIDSRIMPADLSDLWNNYRYVDDKDLGNGKMMMLFVKVMSDEERNTPFRTISSFGNHRWPPILLSLELLASSTFSGAYPQTNYFVREQYIPDVSEGTRFITEEFFSDIPYTIPKYKVPIPQSVSYDVQGVRGSFPECLHDDIRINPTRTFNVITQITGNAPPGTIGGQFFPATNFPEWATYIMSDDSDFQNGYYRKRIRVIPPSMPDPIIRLNR